MESSQVLRLPAQSISCVAQEGSTGQQPRRDDSEGKHVSDSERPTPRVDFIDLPNEIILYILGHLPEDDLYGLSLLSRRMNYMSLPLYLSRRSFGSRPNDRLVLFDYNSRDVLRALNVTLFKTSLTRLHYPLDCEKPPGELKRELRAMHGLLTRNLSSLREVTIDFHNIIDLQLFDLVLQTPVSEVVPKVVPSSGVPNELQSELIELLDAVIDSGCMSLAITYCGSQRPVMDNIDDTISLDFGWGARMCWQSLRPLASLFRASASNAKNNNLEAIYLHSSVSFHPHLARWTIEILNSSRITSLSISQQLCIGAHSWALILPCVAIPMLTNLSLDSCTFRLSDLFKFVNRHPNIRKLSLGRSFRFTDAQRSLSIRKLGKLAYLSAPPHALVPFLRVATEISTPLLSSITILLRVPHEQNFTLGMLDDPLDSSFPRLKSMTELHLALSFGSIPTTWLDPLADADSSHSTANTSTTGVRTLITHLEVHIKVYSLPFPLATKLTELLVQFPNLKRVKVVTLSKVDPLTALQKDIAIRVMTDSCPQLDSVEFVAEEL
ncbi:hypothetical protein GALMADRAFT_221863 [Galerina marginata CBS 339.88]|uniref:F-box domain-containing protein n=1 Tax=Galerina marginata (strain CBS 339.88) TaxID=685588 RepID=A0A067TI24_GALM3|nr:hypothetical protein GALMADRAFT_221863 [Galerina marginata CBS 339.88]